MVAHSRPTLNLFSLMTFDPDLFKEIVLPEGVERERVEDAILLRCAECALIYTEPAFVKYRINTWFKQQYSIINELFQTTILTYDPLKNVNMNETYQRTTEGDENKSGSESDVENETEIEKTDETENVNKKVDETETINRTEDENTTGSSSANSESKVSAFNSSTYQPDNTVDSEGTNSSSRDLTDDTSRDRDVVDTTSRDHDVSRDLNIGRNRNSGYKDERDYTENEGRDRKWEGLNNSDPQDLIQKQRELVQFNLYEWIANKFEDAFCYTVY